MEQHILFVQHALYNNSEHLFCFFTRDIKERDDLWKLNEKQKEYILRPYGNTFKEHYQMFYFNENRVKALKDMIEQSDMDKEFFYGFSEAKITIPLFSCSGSTTTK